MAAHKVDPKEPKCPIANMVCPKNNDPEKGTYCPAWVQYTEDNLQTQEVRLVEECFYAAMIHIQRHVISAANRPAAAIENNTNEIAKGFSMITTGLSAIEQVARDRDRRLSRRQREKLIPAEQIDEEEEEEEWD